MYPKSSFQHKHKPKISLKAQNQNSLQIEPQLIKRAINNSYTKQLAQHKTLQLQEMTQAVAMFALSFLPKIDIEKQLEEYWCIVAVNQKGKFGGQGVFSFNSNSNSLYLYELFVGLGGKQLRLQSLQFQEHRFVLNLDTVPFIVESIIKEENQTKLYRIRLISEDKLDIELYFNDSVLPFAVTSRHNIREYQRILSEMYFQTRNILQRAMRQSKGNEYKLSSKQLPDSQYYYYRYATEQQFSKYAQTGDILLFKDNHTFAKIQRFITNSQSDHMGIVFRDQKYGLCMFESNSGTGVSLVMWNQLIRYKWFKNIQGIYWRRLNIQNKAQNFEQKVRQFVKVNLHKEYGFSLGKLLRFKQIVYDDPSEEKNRTYFCSQLIAALYKYLGILQEDKPSSRYLPKDFTQKGSLNMINNSALECERRLIFNEQILKESYKFYK